MIAEADAIIINAEGHGELPRCPTPVFKCDGQFVVAVQDRLRLAPWQVPSLVKRARSVADGRKRAVKLRCIREQKAHFRPRDHGLARAADLIGGLAERAANLNHNFPVG